MYKHERQANILELLSANGFCSTEDLADTLGVSQTTLYRNMKELEEAGAIQKQYGGVVLARKFISNIDFKVREGLISSKKRPLPRKRTTAVTASVKAPMTADEMICRIVLP